MKRYTLVVIAFLTVIGQSYCAEITEPLLAGSLLRMQGYDGNQATAAVFIRANQQFWAESGTPMPGELAVRVAQQGTLMGSGAAQQQMRHALQSIQGQDSALNIQQHAAQAALAQVRVPKQSKKRSSTWCCVRTPNRLAACMTSLVVAMGAGVAAAIILFGCRQPACPTSLCATPTTNMTGSCFDVRLCQQGTMTPMSNVYPPFPGPAVGADILDGPLAAFAREQGKEVCVIKTSCAGTPWQKEKKS